MSEVFLKVFKDAKYTMVAVCDTGLIGETYRDGKLKLEIKSDFYKGIATTVQEALHAISNADIANLTGNRIVDAAVSAGLVSPLAILRIAGIQHAQIVRL
ncbi:MAG: DUF424 domain-containing protein [Candidatus Bathyarchaeia archaeon]